MQDTIEKSELNTKELAAEKIKSDTSEIETTTGLKDDKSEEQNLLGDEITINLDIDSKPFETDDSTEDEQEEEIGLEDGQRALKSKDFIVNSIAKILKASSVYDASDIHIEPQQDRLRIRYRIDGILTEKYSLNKTNTAGIIARCKVLSRLDVAEKRLPQDGRLRVSFESEILDFRVSTLPGKYGEKIVMRALRSDNSILNLGKLVSSQTSLIK